jgi:hypothetical protein
MLDPALRVLALVDTGEVTEARRVCDEEVEARAAKLDTRLHAQPHMHANLARGRLLVAEGKRDEGIAQIRRVVDDIRTGAALRDRARAALAAA